MEDLEQVVEEAFARRAAHLPRWPDPHPDGGMPDDDQYSRVTDPDRWRIVPARAMSWCDAATGSGVAILEGDAPVRWVTDGGARYRRVDRLSPVREGTVPLVLADAAPGPGAEPTGVTIGMGDPAVVVGQAPACGCDACDDGSDAELDRLDDQIRHVLLGEVRHLRAGDRTIVAHADGWSASGSFRRGEVERALADPTGWEQVAGAPWIDR